MSGELNSKIVGDLVRIEGTLKDIDATLVDATEMTVTVKPPSGANTVVTWGAAEVTKSSTGVYYYDFQTTLAGMHYYRFEATGVVAVSEGSFYVGASQV